MAEELAEIDLTDCVEIRKVPQFGPELTNASGCPAQFRVFLSCAMLRKIWPQLHRARGAVT